jgi:hypothetical protein
VLPYIFLLHLDKIPNALLQSMGFFLADTHLGFRWWFLDHYVSAGAQLGWPGLSFLIYYAFSAAWLVFLTLIGGVVLLKKQSIRFSIIAIPAIGLLAYFLIAEILPRFGVYFLPDRAMNEAYFFAVVTLIVLLTEYGLPKVSSLWAKTGLGLMALAAVTGGIGVPMLLAFREGGLVSRREADLISFINTKLPSEAVVISSQRYNNTMIMMYAERHPFLAISLPQGPLPEMGTLTKYIAAQTKKDTNIVSTVDHKTIKTLIEVRQVVNELGQQLSVSQKTVSEQVIEEPGTTLPSVPSTPLYFVYSFAKTDGLLSKMQRIYWVDGIDVSHAEAFRSLIGAEVVYKDDAGIILKVR